MSSDFRFIQMNHRIKDRMFFFLFIHLRMMHCKRSHDMSQIMYHIRNLVPLAPDKRNKLTLLFQRVLIEPMVRIQIQRRRLLLLLGQLLIRILQLRYLRKDLLLKRESKSRCHRRRRRRRRRVGGLHEFSEFLRIGFPQRQAMRIIRKLLFLGIAHDLQLRQQRGLAAVQPFLDRLKKEANLGIDGVAMSVNHLVQVVNRFELEWQRMRKQRRERVAEAVGEFGGLEMQQELLQLLDRMAAVRRDSVRRADHILALRAIIFEIFLGMKRAWKKLRG